MQRYKLTIDYFGPAFHGVTKCPGVQTVCSELERAVEKLVGADNASKVVASSRTDTGVHALANVCHVDLTRRRRQKHETFTPHPPQVVQKALNRSLQNVPLSIRNVELVDSEFHSRYHATGRVYKYYIMMPHSSSELRPSYIFLHNRVWLVDELLDVEAMQTAAEQLVGTHDFSTFRGSGCEAASPVKTIVEIKVAKQAPDGFHTDLAPNYDFIQIQIAAKSFLYRMVRNIVGCLYEVGTQRLTPVDVKEMFQAKDRQLAPKTAPAHGLYLNKVEYGKPVGLERKKLI